MNIHTSIDAAGIVCVRAAGELDLATADRLRDALHEAIIQPGVTKILLDFAEVSFCDSSGIDVLDRAHADAAAQRIVLQVVNPRPPVRRVLDLVGLLGTLTGA
ncbi:STAS domain-containing protein [Actinoplanes xinjiangensis]|uniref:STAS domain-containing protein n=1 Tax=Actinoplanes xinjiangensis TaxID=512350 RepID=UPI00341A0FC2